MAGTSRKKRAQKNSDDPERRRLEDAHAAAKSPTIFLPDPRSNGVGKVLLLNKNHTHALKALFYLIVAKVSDGVTWGDGKDEDPRRRMYGFMPRQRLALVTSGIKIQKEGAQGNQEHVDAMQRGSVDFVFHRHGDTNEPLKNPGGSKNQTSTVLILDESIYDALFAITQQVQYLVPGPYKKFVTMDSLIAAQPNLHNGASYLPAHLDFPRQDGFGVVIVTFGVRGSGVIVLIDDGDHNSDDSRSFAFALDENESYILCGDARNKCTHGVLCQDDKEGCLRETLNLRYGLHSTQFAIDEVDMHWTE